MALVWSEEFITGIEEVDAQHKAIFKEISSLAMGLLEGQSAHDMQAGLVSLCQLLREHINFEELLMYEEGCSEAMIWGHAEDHQILLHHLNDSAKSLMTQDEIRAFVRYVVFWMRYHILTIDKPVCYQILEMRKGINQEKAEEASAQIVLGAVPLLLGNLHQTYSELYDSQLQVVHQNAYLRETHHHLKDVNLELERHVAERTLELNQTHENLKKEYQHLQALNEKLENAQAQLLQSDKMAGLGQLAAGIAHEINNPVGFVNANLGTLKGYVDSLLSLISVFEQVSDELPPAVQKRLNEMKSQMDLEYIRQDILDLLSESTDGLDRVKQIVQDLKDFARAGEAVWQESDLHKGLDSTLNVVWNEVKYKAKVLKEYGDIPLVRCIPAQINQVFMNILVNAAHAIEGMGEITIRSGRDGDQVWISIQDNGRGMTEDVQRRIFEPFYTTKPVGKGTGLGLSLTYSIIQKHHGRIDVESQVGVGSTFTIWLPIEGADHVPT